MAIAMPKRKHHHKIRGINFRLRCIKIGEKSLPDVTLAANLSAASLAGSCSKSRLHCVSVKQSDPFEDFGAVFKVFLKYKMSFYCLCLNSSLL